MLSILDVMKILGGGEMLEWQRKSCLKRSFELSDERGKERTGESYIDEHTGAGGHE